MLRRRLCPQTMIDNVLWGTSWTGILAGLCFRGTLHLSNAYGARVCFAPNRHLQSDGPTMGARQVRQAGHFIDTRIAEPIQHRHQATDGAIIDPFLNREVQYSTPYFAYAVGTLVKAGRAPDLLPHGVAAMEHSTLQFSEGRSAIPDQHSEFFIAALTESLDVYEHLVPASRLELWRSRLQAPISGLVGPNRNNWMTYAMKGEWLRYRHGLVSRAEAVEFIETSWKDEQRARILPTPFHLYHDRSSDPDALSVETVGRSNLLALIEAGYDGPSAAEIRTAVFDGTYTSLCLQDTVGAVAREWPHRRPCLAGCRAGSRISDHGRS